METIFKTSEIGEAAFLYCNGICFDSVDFDKETGEWFFSFEHTNETKQCSLAYRAGANVQGNKLSDAYMIMQGRINVQVEAKKVLGQS